MYIKRVQVEEGFLDGLDLRLEPGLNAIIGARGTGKTSVIELVRFCLNATSHTPEARKRSLEHALSVLGSGQVTITIADGDWETTITRTADENAPRMSSAFVPPIIFSQTEIESVGLSTAGRLSLIDSFLGDQRSSKDEESLASAEVRSLTEEAASIRHDIEELNQQYDALPDLVIELNELAPAEQRLSQVSAEAAEKKMKLDKLTESMSAVSVAHASVQRFATSITRWRTSLANAASSAPAPEGWAEEATSELLSTLREDFQAVHQQIINALDKLDNIESKATRIAERAVQKKISLEEQARQIRKDIENLQTGAGAVMRQGQQLRERMAQLESLRKIVSQRVDELSKTTQRRRKALDRLDEIREQRFKARASIANRLNEVLGPRIRILIEQAGQFESLSAAIAEALRGSGLRYGDLAANLAQRVSPREILEAAEVDDYELIAEAASISKDRAARVLTHMRESDLGAVVTATVEDGVAFQLLDGQDYKDIGDLSTGQRCTVVLPMVLQHTERVLIVDQPEDHIDNAFVADTLIKSILARGPDSQIIFSTHNANIPVLGDADTVIHMGSDGRRGFVIAAGPLEHPKIVTAISTVMEGGAEAFERRASFYGRLRQR